MSQDTVADTLNQMLNAKKAGKNVITVKAHSKLLLSLLAIAKLKGYVEEYKVDKTTLTITLGKLNSCRAIKPRFMVHVDEIDRYIEQYLPSRYIGTIILSTTQGLMTHQTAIEKNLGGSLIAYLY